MKGKINFAGELFIERAGKWVMQECRESAIVEVHNQHQGTYYVDDKPASVSHAPCSHHCPFFCEPNDYTRFPEDEITYELRLCRKVLEFTEFTDERTNAKEK